MNKILKKNFLGFFKKKQEAQVAVRNFDEEEFKKLSEFRENQRHLSKAEQYYIELRKQREEQEAQKLEEQRILDEANIAYEREEETTVRYLDYRAIMLNNQRILPQAEFDNIDDFLDFIVKFNYDSQQLNEQNFNKIFKAFNRYSDEIDESIIAGPFYQKFLDHVRNYVYTFNNGETLVQLSMFLDIYCVSYPELYVKFQRQIVKLLDDLSTDDVVFIIVGMSNQGEGEDDFWDKIETKLMLNLDILTTEQLVNTVQSFFNVQVGTKLFIDKILNKLIEKLEDKYLKPTLQQILVVSNTLSFLQEDIIKDQRDKIWQLCEQRIIQSQDFLTFELACKLANAFGTDRGSNELFEVLVNSVKEETNDLQDINQNQFKLFLEGFVFTYRIQEKNLDLIIQKFNAFKDELEPKQLACFAKALYMYSRENDRATQDIEQMIIQQVKDDPQSLDKQSIYYILQSYLATRMGSRQFYRLLEFYLPSVLKNHIKDKEFLQTVKEMYEKSQLCSLEFLSTLQRLLDLEQIINLYQLLKQMKNCKTCINFKNNILEQEQILNQELREHEWIEREQQKMVMALQDSIQKLQRELAITKIEMQKEEYAKKKELEHINSKNVQLRQRILALQGNSLERQHSFRKVNSIRSLQKQRKSLQIVNFQILKPLKKKQRVTNFLQRKNNMNSITQATNNETNSKNLFKNISELSFLSNSSENQLACQVIQSIKILKKYNQFRVNLFFPKFFYFLNVRHQ